jgi:hypothetical protein
MCSLHAVTRPSRPIAPMSKMPNPGGQALRRSARHAQDVAKETPIDNPGELSRSPTPTWSRGSNAGSQGEPELDSEHPVPQSTELQPEDDPFMPTTLQVVQTLAGMRSRHDRGNEVSATPPNVPCKALGIDV